MWVNSTYDIVIVIFSKYYLKFVKVFASKKQKY